jgi:hypothetical protein
VRGGMRTCVISETVAELRPVKKAPLCLAL